MASLCLVRHKTNIRSLGLELEGMLAKVSTEAEPYKLYTEHL